MSPPEDPRVELLLRETLSELAEQVETSPHAYRRTQAAWRRRERRRRLLVVALATLAIGAADGLGLWALNSSAPHHPVVFDAPPPARP